MTIFLFQLCCRSNLIRWTAFCVWAFCLTCTCLTWWISRFGIVVDSFRFSAIVNNALLLRLLLVMFQHHDRSCKLTVSLTLMLMYLPFDIHRQVMAIRGFYCPDPLTSFGSACLQEGGVICGAPTRWFLKLNCNSSEVISKMHNGAACCMNHDLTSFSPSYLFVSHSVNNSPYPPHHARHNYYPLSSCASSYLGLHCPAPPT